MNVFSDFASSLRFTVFGTSTSRLPWNCKRRRLSRLGEQRSTIRSDRNVRAARGKQIVSPRAPGLGILVVECPTDGLL
jgi:hypothetical protein